MNETEHVERAGGRGRRGISDWWRPVLLIAVLVAIWIAASVFGFEGRLAELRDWIEGLGLIGMIVFILIRAGAAVAVIPGSALSAVAGALFSPVTAVICVSAGKTLGACLSFVIARYFAREAVARWLSTKPKFHRVDESVARHGAVVVAVMRLVPVIPFNVQNYGFGLTPISFGTYLFWSWLCMLPGAILVVTGTVVIIETLSTGQVPWSLLCVLGLTVLIMIGLAVYVLLKLRAERAARTLPADSHDADGAGE